MYLTAYLDLCNLTNSGNQILSTTTTGPRGATRAFMKKYVKSDFYIAKFQAMVLGGRMDGIQLERMAVFDNVNIRTKAGVHSASHLDGNFDGITTLVMDMCKPAGFYVDVELQPKPNLSGMKTLVWFVCLLLHSLHCQDVSWRSIEVTSGQLVDLKGAVQYEVTHLLGMCGVLFTKKVAPWVMKGPHLGTNWFPLTARMDNESKLSELQRYLMWLESELAIQQGQSFFVHCDALSKRNGELASVGMSYQTSFRFVPGLFHWVWNVLMGILWRWYPRIKAIAVEMKETCHLKATEVNN